MPEAEALAGACDHVLVKSDGMSFSMICIVDAETDPSRKFGLDRNTVVGIAKACREQYCGTINGAKMPAQIEIIETRRNVSPDDIHRLKPLHARLGVMVMAYTVDLATSMVTVNAWSLFNARRRLLERSLRAPRQGEADLVPPEPAAVPEDEGQPVLTYLLLGVLAAVFVLELVLAVSPAEGLLSPSVRTLIALGGLHRPLVVEQGEWHRLFTAAFLHGSLIHLVLNGLALWMAGVVLEHLLGRAWLLALFFAGAIGGSLLSLALNPAEIVSVGASGAIMGLLAAASIASFRFPSGADRTQIQLGLLRILVPSLIPIAAVRVGDRIDFAAHLGGVLVGLVLGAVLLATWPRSVAHPRFAGVARAVATAAIIVFGWSAYETYAGYSRHALARFLIPDDQLPKTDEEAVSRSAALLASYPRDPRSHLFGAVAALNANDAARAEAAIRSALGDREMLRDHFTPELEVLLTSVLAEALVAQGRDAEARKEAAPFCKHGSGGAAPERLKNLGVCEEP